MLSSQEWILIAIIAATMVVLVTERFRADLLAILLMGLMPLTGVVTYQDALSGFSRSVVITIICLFIITETLERTGTVQWIADRLREIGGGSEARLIVLFMGAGAALSLLMNNVAAGAVLLPAAVQVSRESNVPPSKLLMPLAFGTLVGGMATYFTTANIILSTILRDQGQSSLGMIDFVPTGGLIVLITLFFMSVWGRKLLPSHETAVKEASANMLSQRLSETYQLSDRLWEVIIKHNCRLAGKSLSESKFGATLGITVAAIWRGHQAIFSPAPSLVLQEGDVLLIAGREERVQQLHEFNVEIGRSDGRLEDGHEYVVDLTELIIPPRSKAIGKTLAELDFRKKYEITGVALWRKERSYRTDVGKMPLEVGDALLMVGTPQNIRRLTKDPDFIVLQSSHAARPPIPHKARIALIITALVLLISIIELIPTSEAMLLGVAALAFTGCINLDEAYRSISWRVIFLIAGMLPISLALVNTGLAEKIGHTLVTLLSPFGSFALIGGLFLLTAFVTQIIGGQVSALIMGPIAVTTALNTGMNAQAVGVAVAIACSAAFLTPLAHPVNVLMMSPGGYSGRDFLRVGVWMMVLTFCGTLAGMYLFWNVR
ncbi:MAG: SLC13 family permease [Caldilineaceae bacterium]